MSGSRDRVTSSPTHKGKERLVNIERFPGPRPRAAALKILDTRACALDVSNRTLGKASLASLTSQTLPSPRVCLA